MDAAARADQLRAELLKFGAVDGVVGCQVVGAAPVIRAWGAVSDASVFEAGSVSKIVTGLLLALAIQAAEVSADDRLDRYLPGTGRAGQATLAELATHTSGLPRLPAPVLVRALLRPRNPYFGVTLPRLVRYTRMVRPGQAGKAVYSNLGVALLGHALARAAGLPYWDLARERVLHPLGMSRSGDLPTSALAAPDGHGIWPHSLPPAACGPRRPTCCAWPESPPTPPNRRPRPPRRLRCPRRRPWEQGVLAGAGW
jgi:serine-type D-Ala-D-Ala carboxypeptidase/endopeptidase